MLICGLLKNIYKLSNCEALMLWSAHVQIAFQVTREDASTPCSCKLGFIVQLIVNYLFSFKSYNFIVECCRRKFTRELINKMANVSAFAKYYFC